MKWIINHKRYKISYFIGSLFVMTAEMVMLSICGVFAFSIFYLSGRDWYQSAVLAEAESDMLFREKIDSIFAVLWIAILFICIFCFIAVCLFRKMQMEDIAWILSVYHMIGYSKSKIRKMLLFDIGIDLMISISFAYLIMSYVMKYLSRERVFYVMIHMTGSPAVYFLFDVISAIVLLMVLYLYDRKSIKKVNSQIQF